MKLGGWVNLGENGVRKSGENGVDEMMMKGERWKGG